MNPSHWNHKPIEETTKTTRKERYLSVCILKAKLEISNEK